MRVLVGDKSFTVDAVNELNCGAEYPAYLDALKGVRECTPTGDSIVLRDFSTQVKVTWSGLTDWEKHFVVVVFLLDFCVNHSLSITNRS